VHHDRASRHRGQGVGHGQAAVVVRVNAEAYAAEPAAHLGEDGPDVEGQGAAVGVAQHDHVRPGLGGRGDGGQRVVAVAAEAVEEMLGVIDDFAAVLPQEAHGVADHGQVFFQAGFDHPGDVQVPALAEDGGGRGSAAEEGLQVMILLGTPAGLARAAESRQAGVFERVAPRQLEELQVLGIGPRPSAFDVMNPDVVQAQGDLELFLGAEGDVFALGPVAQGGVVKKNGFHRAYFLFSGRSERTAAPARHISESCMAASSRSSFWR